jgi:hypothetical protein
MIRTADTLWLLAAVLLILCLAALSGCSTQETVHDTPTNLALPKAALDQAAKDSAAANADIRTHAKAIQTLVTQPTDPDGSIALLSTVNNHAAAIMGDTLVVDSAAGQTALQVKGLTDTIAAKDVTIGERDKTINSLTTQVSTLKSNREFWWFFTLHALTVLGLIGLGVGVWQIVQGNLKWGMSLAVLGFTLAGIFETWAWASKYIHYVFAGGLGLIALGAIVVLITHFHQLLKAAHAKLDAVLDVPDVPDVPDAVIVPDLPPLPVPGPVLYSHEVTH